MKKTGNILLVLTVAILLFWQLPWLYSFATSKKDKSPFTLYSSLIEDFTFSYYSGSETKHMDLKGNYYTQNELDSIHPFFTACPLFTDEKFPETIKGIPCTF